MKHIQSVTIILKSGRQVVLTSTARRGSPHGCSVSGGTSDLPRDVIESLHMDVRGMDLNLDYLFKKR